MIISIASGKGGTGKTLIATSLALSLKDKYEVTLVDCDVEEPNDHIFIRPQITGTDPVEMRIPVVSEQKCTFCGECARICAYKAIAVFGKHVLTFPQLCHGCGACSYLCPEIAIIEETRKIGVVEWGNSDGIKFVQGILNVGEAMAPPVIHKVKEYAKNSDIIIRDAPPGTSCPVVETVRDSDFCLLLTEPTPFGLNDLILAVETVRELDIPYAVIINRTGIGDAGVEDYCREEKILVLLTIPLDTEIARLYSRGVALVDGMPHWKSRFLQLYSDIKEMVDARTNSIKR
ncbi:MAG: ATP-binding protein [Dehalococcoidales bacterium]|jgi:MinD superfamily P-loop ATPase|nr:ATP-binding protein [Dehalococcoidales bacterium]